MPRHIPPHAPPHRRGYECLEPTHAEIMDALEELQAKVDRLDRDLRDKR